MGETEKAIYHFEVALFMIICFGLIIPRRSCFPAKAGSTTHRLHVDQAKSHAVNNTLLRLSDVCISQEVIERSALSTQLPL